MLGKGVVLAELMTVVFFRQNLSAADAFLRGGIRSDFFGVLKG